MLCTMMLSAKDYNASMFGVKSDGKTLNTGSIQKAVDFISENGGGRLVFYVGRYLTGSIQLKSNVIIQLKEGAILVGTTLVYDYFGVNGKKALIYADNQENIGVIGKGVIEGQGRAVLNNICIQIKKGYLKEAKSQSAPALINLNNCNNVTIEGVNLYNACGDVQIYTGCSNLNISKITVNSIVVTDSKGMLFSGCDGLTLNGSFFETSGVELSSTGTSEKMLVKTCINAKGKKIHAKK